MNYPSIGTEPIADLLARVASTRPGPAAGSAAALAAGLAAGLIGKTARLSTRELPDAVEWAERADRLRAHAVALADADADAVVEMLGGRGVDPGSAAVAVPEQIADLAAELADCARRLSAAAKPQLRADTFAAEQLADSAAAISREILQANANRTRS